jgi:hypothetical protein
MVAQLPCRILEVTPFLTNRWEVDGRGRSLRERLIPPALVEMIKIDFIHASDVGDGRIIIVEKSHVEGDLGTGPRSIEYVTARPLGCFATLASKVVLTS